MFKYVAVALIAIVLVSPLAASLSLVAAFVAIVFPQTIAFSMFLRNARLAPFTFWAIKFSLSILLLSLALRILHSGDLFSPHYFIAGVIVAVAANVFWAARLASVGNRER